MKKSFSHHPLVIIDRHKRVIELWKQGLSYRQIAEKVGYRGHRAVGYVIEQYKLLHHD